MKILLDMNLSPVWVPYLQNGGHEAKHWSEIGDVTAPSVIQLRIEDIRPEQVGELVLTALSKVESEIRRGALVTIDPRKARIRLLPFKADGISKSRILE